MTGQKALTEMNLQLANVISDISGTTGLRILHAIVEEERDPQRLATFTAKVKQEFAAKEKAKVTEKAEIKPT